MYAILDGRVRIWNTVNGQPHMLDETGRGALIGEVAHFADRGLRTATIETTEDVRMLGLSEENMRRLGRRHPRISLQLLRNLNTYQAQRLARQTAGDPRTDEPTPSS